MKVLLAGAIAVAIIVGGYVVLHKSPVKSNTPSASSSTSLSPSSSASDSITFDGSMFSPASLSVKSGTTITIKNTSSDDLEFDSNPHPAHTDDTDLNVGIVSPG